MPSTPRGLPYPPFTGVAPNGAQQLQDLAEALDLSAFVMQGTAASIPPAGAHPWTFYFETDTGLLLYSNGTAWQGPLLSAGSVVAAMLAANAVTTSKIQDGAVTLPKREVVQAVRVTRAASFNVPGDGVGHPLLFDTERFDPLGMHSTSSNTSRLVAPVAGVYQVNGSVRTNDLSPPTTWSAFLYLNKSVGGISTTNGRSGDSSETADFVLSVSDLVSLSANQYVELVMQHTLSAGDVFDMNFSMALVGRIA